VWFIYRWEEPKVSIVVSEVFQEGFKSDYIEMKKYEMEGGD